MNNKDISKEWFKMAELDFDSAKFLVAMKPRPIEIICYHCQQSAEKYLKGFIAYNGGIIPKTHDLQILNKECCYLHEGLKIIQDECIDLTDYGVQVRYPFHMELNEHDAKAGVKNAENIRKQILRVIEELEEGQKMTSDNSKGSS